MTIEIFQDKHKEEINSNTPVTLHYVRKTNQLQNGVQTKTKPATFQSYSVFM
jgi:hypothetical protein